MPTVGRASDKTLRDDEITDVAAAWANMDVLHCMPKTSEKHELITSMQPHSGQNQECTVVPSTPKSSPSTPKPFSRGRSMTKSEISVIDQTHFMAGFDIRAELSYQENRKILNERKLMIPQHNGSAIGVLVRQQTERLIGKHPCKLTRFLSVQFTRREAAIVLQKLGLMSAALSFLSFSMETSCRLQEERRWIAELKICHFCASIVYALLSMGELIARFDTFLLEVKRNTCKVARRSQLDEDDSLTNPAVQAAAETWNPVVSPSWLILDMVALIGVFGEFAHLHEEPEGVPTQAQCLTLFNVLKIWRWLLPAPDRSNERSTFWGSILELFCSLVLFTHTYACIFGLIATIETHKGRPTWADSVLLVDEGSEMRGCYDFYMAALYFSAYTVTSIGYGDICPANTFEQGVDALGMIIAQMYLAQVFADLNFITATHQHWQAEHHKSITQISAAFHSMGMTGTLHDRVLAYQDFVWQVQKEQTAKEMLEELSPLLQEEVKIILHSKLVLQAPFLHKLSTRAVRYLVASLVDCIYLPGDFIMRRGDLGSELYFLRDGCAAIFLELSAPSWHDRELKLLRRGEYFGEVAVLTGAKRSSWVMARTYCVCSVLQRKSIDEVMDTEPRGIAALASSMSKAYDLKREWSWEQVAHRINDEFDDEGAFFRFLCSGEDGLAPAGLVTWPRYQTLMQRLGIPLLDQKLLWVELDTHEEGEVGFDDVIVLLRRGAKTSPERQSEVDLTQNIQSDHPENKQLLFPERDPNQPDANNRPRTSARRRSTKDVPKDPLTMLHRRVQELATHTESQFADLRNQINDIAVHLGVPKPPEPEVANNVT